MTFGYPIDIVMQYLMKATILPLTMKDTMLYLG
jgi:hypothetical protein